MKNIIINRKNRTITITKAFDKMASIYGSDEYKQLRDVMNDNTGFRVIVKATKQKKETNKGLTYNYMETYIIRHDDKEGTLHKTFEMMTGRSKEAKENMAEAFSYNDVKEWFFSKFPEIEAFHKKREDVLNEIEKAREVRAAKKKKDAEKAEEERKNKIRAAA